MTGAKTMDDVDVPSTNVAPVDEGAEEPARPRARGRLRVRNGSVLLRQPPRRRGREPRRSRAQEITAFIGPSGCGKSTFLRCLNRMNDLIAGAKVDGRAPATTAIDLYDPKVDPVEVRRRIGMVFQKPNPFPKSIYDNIAFGPRVNGQGRTSTSSSRRRCTGPRSGTR